MYYSYCLDFKFVSPVPDGSGGSLMEQPSQLPVLADLSAWHGQSFVPAFAVGTGCFAHQAL
jgi:hypothetical protein